MVVSDRNAEVASQMKEVPRRLINFRAFLVLFVAIILACLCGALAARHPGIGLILFIVISGIATIVFFVLRLTKISFFKIAVLLASVICFVATFLNFFITAARWDVLNVNGSYRSVEGVVDYISDVDDIWTITIKKLTINGKKAKGKIVLYVDGSEHDFPLSIVAPGYRVAAKSSIMSTNLIDSDLTVNAQYKRMNIRYVSSVRENDELIFAYGKMPFLAKVRKNIDSIFTRCLGAKYGGLAIAMLTGNKTNMSADLNAAFGASGIGHILAVSGMHIALLAAVLLWVLDRGRFGRVLTIIVLNLFFLLYLFLADFSPSVIRAVITYEILLIVKYTGFWRDSLSTLCFAGCVVLLFSPFSLFDGGFILSFSAVFSIILFNKPILKFLTKLKLPKWLAKGLAVSTSVQFGTVPAIIGIFNEIQLYSVLTNVLLMPLISFAFIAIFLFLVLILIFPFFEILLTIVGIVFPIIDLVVRFISKLPFAIIIYSSFGVFSIYICLFFISRFYMARRKISGVKIAAVFVSCVFLLNGLFHLPKSNQRDNFIIPIDDYGFVTSIVRSAGRTYLVGDCGSYYSINDTIKRTGITRFDAIYLTSFNPSTVDTIINLYYRYDIKKIYLPVSISSGSGVISLIDGGVDNFVFISDENKSDGFTLLFDKDENFLGYKQNTQYVSILHAGKDTRLRLIDTNVINECAIIRARTFQRLYANRIQLTQFDAFIDVGDENVYAVNEIGKYLFVFSEGVFYGLD